MTTSRSEYLREWRAKNADKVREQKRAYYERHKERILARMREDYAAKSPEDKARKLSVVEAWKAANPTKVLGYKRVYRARKGSRAIHHRVRYNLTPEEYRDALVGQAARCASCGDLAPRLVVDHDHARGTFRALLCHHCNVLLGAAREEPRRLLAAIDYLKAFTR